MITQDNITAILNDISEAQVTTAYEVNSDYISLTVSFTNSGHSINFECVDYSEELEDEVQSNGNLFCDWDSFLQLVSDSETTNEALLELI